MEAGFLRPVGERLLEQSSLNRALRDCGESFRIAAGLEDNDILPGREAVLLQSPSGPKVSRTTKAGYAELFAFQILHGFDVFGDDHLVGCIIDSPSDHYRIAAGEMSVDHPRTGNRNKAHLFRKRRSQGGGGSRHNQWLNVQSVFFEIAAFNGGKDRGIRRGNRNKTYVDCRRSLRARGTETADERKEKRGHKKANRVHRQP